ncbi:MAG: ABC transporter permease [Amylibacter sp.]|jgi:spermidine/putrescine transport system permease protein|tara:strand:- start:5925 stop:6731 length:807 start_codon:yes stop_codon:yes gene_type:complete
MLPAFAVFVVFFVAPFIYFFVLSFWRVKLYKISPDFSFVNYGKAIERYVPIYQLTFSVAFAVAITCVVLGIIYAGVVRFKAGRWATLLTFIPLMTLFGGYLVKIYAWKTILGINGILNGALIRLGLTGEPLTALFYSPFAVAITLVYFLLPFAILPIYASMRSIEDIELDAARDLGASPWRRFSDIIVPRCRPGIVSAFIICFLLTVGDYVTPILVGGKISMIGNMITPQFGQKFDWPLGAAMSFVTLTLSVGFVVAFSLAMRLWRPR